MPKLLSYLTQNKNYEPKIRHSIKKRYDQSRKLLVCQSFNRGLMRGKRGKISSLIDRGEKLKNKNVNYHPENKDFLGSKRVN